MTHPLPDLLRAFALGEKPAAADPAALIPAAQMQNLLPLLA